MVESNEHINILLAQYKAIMEEAYNLREIDPAISDYDYFEGLKLRKDLELKYNLNFKTAISDLLN